MAREERSKIVAAGDNLRAVSLGSSRQCATSTGRHFTARAGITVIAKLFSGTSQRFAVTSSSAGVIRA